MACETGEQNGREHYDQVDLGETTAEVIAVLVALLDT